MLILCNRRKGVWYFTPKFQGGTKVRHVRVKEGTSADLPEDVGDAPSDLLELDGQFVWVVGGSVYNERT